MILGIFIQSTWPEIPLVKNFLFENLINPILLKNLGVPGLKVVYIELYFVSHQKKDKLSSERGNECQKQLG